MQVRVGTTTWGECVFHVLAHVSPASLLPSSVYSRWYVDFAERYLGPASRRPLGQDVSTLAAGLGTHARLAAVQTVAWLWRETEQAEAAAAAPFSALAGSEALSGMMPKELASDPWAGLLRDAALLEAADVARLPTPVADLDALREALTGFCECLPSIAKFDVLLLRPLTRHGRIRGREIWVGIPGAVTPLDHVACQVAHEASVAAVRRCGRALSEREVEAVALVLLARRVRGTSRKDGHEDWCKAHGVRPHHLNANALSPECRAVLSRTDG